MPSVIPYRQVALMGVMLSAAGSLRWHRDTIYAQHGLRYPTLRPWRDNSSWQRRAVIPALPDRRTHPASRPVGRGAFVGLTVRHTFPLLDARCGCGRCRIRLRIAFETDEKRRPGKRLSQVRVTGGGRGSLLCLATDFSGRVPCRDRHGQHGRRRGIRRSAFGGSRLGRVPKRKSPPVMQPYQDHRHDSRGEKSVRL